MSEKDSKRLFFAFEVQAPWGERSARGRYLEESVRHMTVAFLGQVETDKINFILPQIPLPSFKVGIAGLFEHLLFLPKHHPHVAAYHIKWLDASLALESYQKELSLWLKNQGFSIQEHDHFLPHVTICRSPFSIHELKEEFSPLPCFTSHLHLYESLGNLHYKPYWSCPIQSPFEEIEHTADLAFRVSGNDLHQLFIHAVAALAFRYPLLLNYIDPSLLPLHTIDEVIMQLNDTVSRTDAACGSPFKAISFHNTIEKENGLLKWEMIVDV